MSALLLQAFKALGPAPSSREIALVVRGLRESGDEEVGQLLQAKSKSEAWDRCVALAEEAGSSGFVALDLAVAYDRPRTFRKFHKLVREGML